jgi:S-DNA-T family DNA segregation ATPase FtsK/SpoIIIE
MNLAGKWLNLVGLFVFCLFIFTGVSFLTYSPEVDPPTSTGSTFHNAGGQVGAYLSHYLYRSFGPVSWLLLLWLGLACVELFLQNTDYFDRYSLAGWFLGILGISGLFAWSSPESTYFVPSYLLYRTKPLLGPAGSFLIFSFLTIFGFALKPVSLIRDLFEEVPKSIPGGQRSPFDYLETLSSSGKQYYRKLLSVTGLSGSRSTGSNGGRENDQKPTKDSSTYDSPSPSPDGESDDESSSDPDPDEETDSGSTDTDDSNESDNVIPFEKSSDGSEETEPNDTAEDSRDDQEKSDEPADNDTTDSDSKSPEDTDKSKSSDPIEVAAERPEVDEADMSKYRMPDYDILAEGEIKQTIPDEEALSETASKLEETFEDFGLEGEVVDANPGPVLTMYEVEPGAGVSVKKFESRADDIKLNLAVESVRIVSPIPGKSALGIEVPNQDRALVRLRDVLSSEEFQSDEHQLPLGIGLDVLGEPMVVDLAELPHLLVAGATGSGKSVGLNSMICSLLYRLPPDELKFIMVDPKRVELKLYDGLPHLMTPVIDDTSEATKVLKWAVREMENRYETLSDAGMRDIASYNEKVAGEDGNEKIPYLVIIVDELSDLMLTNPKECEQAITRLAQMARAVGIHMVLATQRPSTDVITGLIKANMPARLSFRVSSGTDSRVILDENGAETLLGNGDLLYLSADSPHPKRGQGSFLSDEETKELIKTIKEQVKPSYVQKEDLFGSSSSGNFDETMDDEYYEDAKKLVVERQKASASMLQRRFRVGYNRAARMIDAMEEEGIVGPHRGSKARNVLVDQEEFLDDPDSD